MSPSGVEGVPAKDPDAPLAVTGVVELPPLLGASLLEPPLPARGAGPGVLSTVQPEAAAQTAQSAAKKKWSLMLGTSKVRSRMAHSERLELGFYAFLYLVSCYPRSHHPLTTRAHRMRDHQALWAAAHAAWAPVATRAFEAVGIGASLVRIGPEYTPPWQPAYGHKHTWHPIHSRELTVGNLELQHGRGRDRVRYNERWLARVAAEKRHFLTEHSGFSDLFVPMVRDKRVIAAIISGPFLDKYPSAASTAEQWRRLAGRDVAASDPYFVHFLEVLQATPVLTGPALRAFVKMVRSVAKLMTGMGDAYAATHHIIELLDIAKRANLERDMHAAVSSMIDERLSASWSSPERHYALADIGLQEAPSDVAAVLALEPTDSGATPIERLFVRIEWQRACMRIAAQTAGSACGNIGDHGVVLLTRGKGTASRRRHVLLELAQAAREAAGRRFRIRAHAGIGPLGSLETLPERFKMSLAAAQQALHRGLPFFEAPSRPERAHPLDELAELTHLVLEAFRARPSQLETIIDRYLQAAAMRSAFRPLIARAYIESLLAQVVRVLKGPGLLERASVDALVAEIEEGVADTVALPELIARYRRIFVALAAAVEHPVVADREVKLRRATAFIGEHFTGRLRMSDVARVAGFAPSHFSRLFKQRHGATFERYVLVRRLDRAKELLRNTDMSIERISHQSGFGSPLYFYEAFRRAVGTTPSAFRREREA
jgi:AraC-like DNA-binding protein